MSFAALVSEMTGSCFRGLGEASVYTPPGEGGTPRNVLVTIEEPNEEPFAKGVPRSMYRERLTSLWIQKLDQTGVAVLPAKGGTVVVTTSHGVVRSFELTSLQEADPDRVRWAATEATS